MREDQLSGVTSSKLVEHFLYIFASDKKNNPSNENKYRIGGDPMITVYDVRTGMFVGIAKDEADAERIIKEYTEQNND